ncbi:MAG TPA: hypothetical protein VGH76_00215 [Actinomycetospora sp.]|uniref:hypothetical protein n=1 Tax=Actinomycetospora sp. TaxID=1872135 RepID=UPI002F3EAD0B
MPATFAEHLERLDHEALTALLTRRRDACIEPLPADFSRLAARLTSASSLRDALMQADSDALEVGRAVVVLGEEATRPAVADLFDTQLEHVDRAVERLAALGLAWESGKRLRYPTGSPSTSSPRSAAGRTSRNWPGRSGSTTCGCSPPHTVPRRRD